MTFLQERTAEGEGGTKLRKEDNQDKGREGGRVETTKMKSGKKKRGPK